MKTALALLLILLLPVSALAQSGATGPSPAPQPTSPNDDILNMDIEQLGKAPVHVPSMDIPVTSVTKEQGTVGQSAAAVFVITPEMIRRSGATCVPEALRMAPGLEVARVNSNTWAITSRGFNDGLANKLLVLIDGRTVYTPVFSGVYWDAQDVLLEDVERIEVIRGPGGTLWGANAVNGVINIITKSAKDTQGAYVGAVGGTVERSTEAVRYGGKIGEDCKYRIYGKYSDRGPFYSPTMPADDTWTEGRVGFRADWDVGGDKTDSLTVQGEHFLEDSGQMGTFTLLTPPSYLPPYSETRYGNTYTTGENLLARWRHVYDEDSDWQLQTYYDNFQRDTILNAERVKTFDVDLQYRFPLGDRQQIICGAGYRYIHDDLPSNSEYFLSIPTERSYFVGSQFLQDEISLAPDLWRLIVGCKLEQNSYTNFEYEPSIRLLYTPDRKHTAWGAISRAVHTPSRIDQDMYVVSALQSSPLFFGVMGNKAEKSEALLAYELGYREQTTDQFSWDLALFYNVYDDLRSAQFIGLDPLLPSPFSAYMSQMANDGTAHTYGAELATNYAVSKGWNLSMQYTYLRMLMYGDTLFQGDGNSPRNQVYLRSSWNLRENVDLDLMARYVDTLSYRDLTGALFCPNYVEMDLRLAWRPRKHLELALVGQNLLQNYHYEFIPTADAFAQVREVPTSVYGTVSWRY